MAEKYELKPTKSAFFNFQFFIVSLFLSIVFFGLAAILFFTFGITHAIISLSVFVILELLIGVNLSIMYKKERYVFEKDKIIKYSGGMFSDSETELIIKNITHVTMKLPFLENKFFKTGYVNIESAGSGNIEASLKSLSNYEHVYSYVEKLMKVNGFSLSKQVSLQKEKPDTKGVVFETIKRFFGSLFAMLFVAFYVFGEFIEPMLENPLLVITISSILLFVLLIVSVFRFLDLKNRVYELYSDTIIYSEGFLSKNYSFMPIENLSDSELTQTFIDRIFDLYDLKISCQGSKQEIVFKNLLNGETFKQNLESQMSKYESLVGTHKEVTKVESTSSELKAEKTVLNVDSDFVADYKINMKRTLIPYLLWLPIALIPPIFIGWLVSFISSIIKVKATRYSVNANTMESTYQFISKKKIEFSNDKITAVVIKEGIIDRWFNTCSIHFWSIGSGKSLVFSRINKTKELVDSITSKFGIVRSEVLYESSSNFKVSEMFKKDFAGTFLAVILIVVFSILTVISPLFIIGNIFIVSFYLFKIIYSKFYYKKQKMSFYNGFVHFKKGLFFIEDFYSLYDDIKGITTVRYPFSKIGSVKFNVAGEQNSTDPKDKSMSISYSFKASFIDNIRTKDELIDLILYKRPNKEQIVDIESNTDKYKSSVILSSKPDLRNSIFSMGLMSIIIFPLLPLLPLTIPYVIISLKMKSFTIENYRLIYKSGIFYKSQQSIVFSKLDHLNLQKGITNKMFNNGSINVNTAGSSVTEMSINNISDYQEFYDNLKSHYN